MPAYISVPADVSGYQRTPLFLAIWWGILFRGPGYTLFGTLPLLVIFLLLEWKNLSSKWLYLIVWVLAGVGASLSIAGVPAGLICGLLYWFFVGQYAGNWKIDLSGTSSKRAFSSGRIVAYGLLLYLSYIAIGYVWYGYKMVEVSMREPSRGIPFFVSYREGISKAYVSDKKRKFGNSARPINIPELGIFQKVALRDFPDVDSCLKGADYTSKKFDLLNLNWNKINNEFEAEVCTFRLLKTLGGIENATPWLEAQGFKSSSKTPHKTTYGTLSVHGSYSIQQNGPKFPTSGFIRRAYRSIPYSMSIVTEWSIDGKELLYVRYSFNRL
ncbi:MAG: hypothetical protein COA52_09465 [Hyphomicrobiales bacterium]|nr:MAG: hypothetical protein COA52_09465 [Hyphomicrobiales bacterium]